MTDSEALRALATALEDITMHMTLLALLPYTVHVDHRAERAEFERRASRERASRLLLRIPTQRLPVDVRTRVRR